VPATSGSLTSTTSDPAAQEACGIRVSPGPSNYFRDGPLARKGSETTSKWLREFDGPTFFAVHEAEPGSVDGYVIWRVQPRWSGGLADNLVRVRELIALTPEAEGALWRLVLDLDLAGTVRIGNRPLDEPCQPTLDAT
jgi:hypothetical protein